MPVRPGEVIAERYEVLAEAGRGGMGTVYRAIDRLSGRQVALKLLRARGVASVERFGREAALLGELADPGIVRYVAHGASDGDPYLVMEWLEGETLHDRIGRGPLTVEETLAIGRRVARALAAAHQRAIVHRDIHPRNIYLVDGALDAVKVVDFGIAHRASQPDRAARPGAIVGTIGYVAPEQARGLRDVDARADVFALGCVLFACLTGHPPFTGDDLVAILAKILLADPPLVSELRSDVPSALADLIDRMLAKDPAERPLDGLVLAAQLDALAGDVGAGGPRAAASPIPTVPVPTSSRAISTSEQRMVCLILVGAPDHAATSSPLPVGRGGVEAALRAVVEAYHARLEVLADGSILVALTDARLPTDQAAGAVRCALAMRALVPDAPMALVSGRALLVGPLPIGEIIDYGVSVLRRARPGTLHVDDGTAGLLESRYRIDRDDEGGAWVVAPRDALDEPRPVLGRPTPFVGRRREVDALVACYRACLDGGGPRAAVVVGPAGAGKSRLRHEILVRLAGGRRPPEVFYAQADALARGAAFGLAGHVTRRACGILEAEGRAPSHRKLAARLARRFDGSELGRLTGLLGHLSGITPADEASELLRAGDPRVVGDLMRDAWLAWLDAECAAGPIALVFEDLHWGDHPSVELVDAALRRLRGRPLFVLALARPELRDTFPALWSGRPVVEVELDHLGLDAGLELARSVLGSVPTERLVELVTRAGGNPFYLEELIRAGAHRGDRELPATVLGMVQARLDELGADAKRVLRAASIFGQTFWREGVVTLTGGASAELDVDRVLAELERAELVFPRLAGAISGAREYAFRHVLVRDAAYGTLTEADRTLGHRLAGAWLQANGEREPRVLAEHFGRGRDAERALGWALRAAVHALEANDLVGALESAEQAVAYGATGHVLARLRLIQAQAYFWRGEFQEAEAHATEALDAATAGSELWFHAGSALLASAGQQGNYAKVEHDVRRLRRESPSSAAATTARLVVLARAVGYLVDGGRLRSASSFLDRAAPLADLREGDPLAAAHYFFALAKAAVQRGDLGAALVGFQACQTAYERAGDERNACENHVNVAYVRSELGDFAGAVARLEQALVTAERMGLQYVQAISLQNLGPILANLGALERAREVELRAGAFFQSQGDRRFEGLSQVSLSLIAFLAGDLLEAECAARAAATILRPIQPALPNALAALARVLLARGLPAKALAAAEEGMAILGTLGSFEGNESLLRLVHAQALDALGRQDEARGVIAIAAQRLRTQAAKIADPTWRTRFLERVPDNAATLRLARAWGVPPRPERRKARTAVQ